MHDETPIALDELSTALHGSVVGRLARRVRTICGAALADSAALHLAFRTGAAASTVESRLLLGGYVLAVAMLTHLGLLAFAEPYPFPGHSRYWLPILLLVFAVTVILLRAPIAAAWRDRQARG